MLRTKFNITFIPLWLENAMARSGMNFSDALNKEKLLSILSKSDIVFYLMANRLFHEVYLMENVESSGMFCFCKMVDEFADNADINTELNIALNTMYKDNPTPFTKEQMFVHHSLGESVDMDVFKDKQYNFIVQQIDDCNVIVRFKLLEDEIPSYKIFGNFYEQLLRVVNFQYPFHEIAKTALFGKYCRYVGMGVNK